MSIISTLDMAKRFDLNFIPPCPFRICKLFKYNLLALFSVVIANPDDIDVPIILIFLMEQDSSAILKKVELVDAFFTKVVGDGPEPVNVIGFDILTMPSAV